jgi:hypothetical protein
MKDRIEDFAVLSRALVDQRPGRGAHPGIGKQITGRRTKIGDHQFIDRFAGQLTAPHQLARQARTQKTRAAR